MMMSLEEGKMLESRFWSLRINNKAFASSFAFRDSRITAQQPILLTKWEFNALRLTTYKKKKKKKKNTVNIVNKINNIRLLMYMSSYFQYFQ